jgi:hypothetical protein
MRPIRTGAVLLTLGLVGVACSDEVIVLATRGHQRSDPRAQRCGTSSDCPKGMFCEHHGCDEPEGECKLPQVSSCPNEEHPVCGSDRVTYFNECLSRVAGVPCYVDGECPEALCNPDTPCPEGAFCAYLGSLHSSETCGGGVVAGRCWVVPTTCPLVGAQWEACGEDPAYHCVNTCKAVRSGKTFSRTLECQ